MKTWSSFLFRFPESIRSTILMLAWFSVGTTWVFAAGVAGISDSVLIQIQTLQNEKASRSPVEQKMDSQFVFALKKGRDRAFANAVPTLRPAVRYEPDGRVLVDIDGAVTPALLKQIEQRGGKVINSFAGFKAIRALLPLDQIEVLSASPDVKFVRPAVRAHTNIGSVDSQGDNTHNATTARNTFGVNGTGVKVGVLSDSVDFLANSQANGDLGPVTVQPGQSGVPGSGEGTAMLEIIHDLAPGAQLFFATAFNGVASFAQNILDLRAAGCDIIVDDVGYFNESPFQDGPIAQAVNTVTAGGALYFSSAANSGNKNDNTSGTWEGDFLDGGVASAPVNGKGGRIHSFGSSTQNIINQAGFGVVLFWSDPLGGSVNDYDLYILNAAGTAVVQSSSNTQNGSQDPYEQVSQPSAGQRVVIVKATGAARYLHLDTLRGILSTNTAGNTKGHSAAVGAFSVAAVNAATSYPNPFVGGTQNPIETFSSDGPRRVFYQADGTAITPGNFLSTGGAVRQKPDIAAADGVSTSVPGFGAFFGTSAAAPHAAAVSALLLSYNSALTPAQVRSLLTSTALDIEAPDVDRDSGSGIVMALPALQAAPAPAPNIVLHSSAISGGNGNNRVDPNECNQLVVTIRNAIGASGGSANGVSATLSTTTPGVTITQPSSGYPNVSAGGTAANITPFQISTAAGLTCGSVVDLVLSVTTANAGNFTIPFQLITAASPILFNSTDVPKAIPDSSSVDSSLTVSGVSGAVGRVTVTLYLTHTYDSDLNISLVGPDSTTVLLSSANGANGNNYGTSCSTRTVFDDSAATPINAGSAPFAGTFRPQQALALFNGKTGNAVNGTWRLRVSDTEDLDVGTIQCWSINLSPSTCTDGGGPCANNPPTLTIDQPAEGTSFAGPADVTIEATASDSDGFISKVEFYNFSAACGVFATVTSPPYSFTLNSLTSGAYSIGVSAFDNALEETTATVNFSVVGPIQSLVNAASPGSTVDIPAGVYLDTVVINKNLALRGAGARSTVIDGNNNGCAAALSITGGATVTFSGLTVTRGGIINNGTLTVNDCAITGNDSRSGIYNTISGTIFMNNCTVSGNVIQIPIDGGGVRNEGTMILNTCTISGNLVGLGPVGSDGGGLLNYGTLSLNNCTVTGNTAIGDAGGSGNGGGIATFAPGTAVSCKSTIIANNTGSGSPSGGGPSPDFYGDLNSQGYNLIGNTAGTVILGIASGNLLNTDPLLGPLQNNGGPTDTHALLPASPAIDAGISGGLHTDQRGVPRPIDRASIANASDGTDIGAFEYGAILFEAESGTLSSPMTIAADPLAFAGQDVASPVNGAGSVSYTVNIPVPGQYVIWCRVLATSSGGDSFFVSVDGGAEDVYDVAEGTWSSLWQWSRVNGRAGGPALTLDPIIFTLVAGAHDLLFRAREPDTRLDRLIVIDDLNFLPDNVPPTISALNDTTIVENTPTTAIGFVVSDAETAASALIVTASSSNTTLVPNSNITLGGSGASRNITVIPAFNQFGVTTIGLTVSDSDGGASSASFVLTVLADSDGDGIPDTFEIANGLDKNDPTDAAIDLDGDGFSNLQEFLLGTNPQSATSIFEITDTNPTGTDVQISLNSIAGKNYRFESSDISPGGPWNTIADVAGNGGTLQVTDVGGAAQAKRFYRAQILP